LRFDELTSRTLQYPLAKLLNGRCKAKVYRVMIRSISRSGFLICALGATSLLIAAGRQARAEDGFYEIETKYIFGFTEGSGIGLEGEKELSPVFESAFGKRDGSYAATETRLEYEFTPNQYIQIELGPMMSSHDIHNVTGLDDRNQTEFAGWFTELRYQLLDRPSSPLAVTLAVEPEWHRIDETSGAPVENYGLETRINADLEIIPDRLFLGSNLLYEPETTRDQFGSWTNETTIGASAALAHRIAPAVVIGGEAWYLRHYGGVGFAPFTGDAVFVGPNLYIQITPKMFVQAAWNVQVGGHEPGVAGTFDLTDFPRNRARLKFAVEF
jgi:hypothetical protein